MTDALGELFRDVTPSLVTALTRAVGPSRLDLVEAVVQEAFVRAMTEWRDAAPDNPAGWLMTVARNLALDHVRRERTLIDKQASIVHAIDATLTAAAAHAFRNAHADIRLAGELADDHVKMIFVVCHPANTLPSQVALALRTLCGLEVPAIARALFATEEAVEKRLVLARRRLREAAIDLELPAPSDLAERRDAVLAVLYLMFNEGYATTIGPELVDEDVAAEALRLTSFLASARQVHAPAVDALLALMHFHAARFPTRVDAAGVPCSLADQDRSRWDPDHIARGLRALASSATGSSASRYHFEAAIAAAHTTSPSFESTPWREIVGFYDQLVELSPSARIGRAVALGYRDGPVRALSELSELSELDAKVDEVAAYHGALGDAYRRAGDHAAARAAFECAAVLATSPHEAHYFRSRIR